MRSNQRFRIIFTGSRLGLLISLPVVLYFGWVNGLLALPIEGQGFPSALALMLFQCLLSGALAGGLTSLTGRWGTGVVVGLGVGFAAGFLLAGRDDPPWDTIGALAMLLPVAFSAGLGALAAAAKRP